MANNVEDTQIEHNTLFYYKYLLKTFGHAELTGCKHLAHILAEYKQGENIKETIKRYIEGTNYSLGAVERSIRVYLKYISKEYTIEELSIAFDYAFQPNTTTLRMSELIPIMKINIV